MIQIRSDAELADSHVNWLARVPTTWARKRLKYTVCLQDQRINGVEADQPYVGLEHIESWTGVLSLPDESLSTGIVNIYKSGDVLLGKLRPYLAKVYLADRHGVCTTEAFVLRCLPEILPGYLFYTLANVQAIENINSSTYGAKMPRANWEFVGNQIQLIPPRDEQSAIINFLDRETARIDALIEKRRRLLGLLEEKRLALMANAVTKGFDLHVTMKYSGDLHIGDVPKNWDVVPLRRILDCGSGDFLTNLLFEIEKADECSIPVVGGNGILGYTSSSNSQGGTLVIGRVGAHCGNVHLVNEACWVTDNALRVTWRKPVHPPYMKRLLDFIGLNRIANRNAQPLITGSMIKDQIVPMPPLNIQKSIASYLDVEEAHINRVAQVEARAISLLQEYRSALIINAVTGKIDVRRLKNDEVVT